VKFVSVAMLAASAAFGQTDIPPMPDSLEKAGLAVANVEPRQSAGVRVTAVRAESPADKVGIRAGDLLVRCNGRRVVRTDDVRQCIVHELLKSSSLLVTIVMQLRRDDHWLTLTMTY
jgi:S1-C subfamily serine protease